MIRHTMALRILDRLINSDNVLIELRNESGPFDMLTLFFVYLIYVLTEKYSSETLF